jgi:Ca2+:H+ antiporter
MMRLIKIVRKDPLAILQVAIPLAILSGLMHWNAIVVFSLSGIGVIPLAHYIGEATDGLAVITGPKIGGLLNATLGNAAELIITIIAIRAGLLDLVKASITGSILGNLLLVLGMSMLFGGLRHGRQTFHRQQAMNNSILLILAVIALVIPSLFSHSIEASAAGGPRVEALSLGVAGIMIVLYSLGLAFNYRSVRAPIVVAEISEIDQAAHRTWSLRTSLVILALATVGVAYLSELLVGSVEVMVASYHISEFFLGVILIPLIGNVAEHLVAVQAAMKNKMDLSVEISVASSLQIALFVAPLLVFISLLLRNPLTLIFNQFELLALIVGVLIMGLVSADGESNWMEGAELLAVYLILGLAFFLLPY